MLIRDVVVAKIQGCESAWLNDSGAKSQQGLGNTLVSYIRQSQWY